MLPTESPYRIDQVTTAPALMASLFLAQVVMASLMSAAAAWNRKRLWNGAALFLLVLVAVFFTLASWGTSDATKISYAYEDYIGFGVNYEPFWWGLGPLVRILPYRMAAVQGLVVAAFAAAPALLARSWGVPGWGGWWSLLICCSPLLHGFLQNSHTRQAFSLLLLLPVFLMAARLVPFRRFLAGGACLLSAMVHTTFPISLALSLSPLLVRDNQKSRPRQPLRLRAWKHSAGKLILILLLILIAYLAHLFVPMYLSKYAAYRVSGYYDTYSIRKSVTVLQWALAGGVLLAMVQRRLGPRRLIRCSCSRLLMLFGLLYLAIQASVRWEWLPQVASRLADPVGFFLLISFLAWLRHYQACWYVLPALAVTMVYWFDDRILASANLMCGQNDDFLCVPDRWPWKIRY
jgi:hypothetical protein